MAEDRVVAILASSGGRWSGIEADGRHPKIVILDARDRQHRIAFNAHPRDHQSECDNIVSRTRRLVADPRYARAKFPDGSHVLVRGGQLELQRAVARVSRRGSLDTSPHREDTCHGRGGPDTGC